LLAMQRINGRHAGLNVTNRALLRDVLAARQVGPSTGRDRLAAAAYS